MSIWIDLIAFVVGWWVFGLLPTLFLMLLVFILNTLRAILIQLRANNQ